MESLSCGSRNRSSQLARILTRRQTFRYVDRDLYALVYPGLKSGFLKMGDHGKARLPEITHNPEYA
ncbi:hypothetical protein [Rubritalea squalenifaciens]|uniref:hypothetical protein n=1 Tax=Rubritalea squalenifaciens TaxID=407226 RepID=UPI00135638FE|nr:hypothetical protein [Rubritalea squalenifaciens]